MYYISFQLPYKPVHIFIGTLYADLPFITGGNFDIRVSDVLVIIEKNTTDMASLHPFVLAKALQLWIGALYFALGNAESRVTQNITTTEIEYAQRLIERLCLKIENCHFRVEEMFTAHIPCPIGLESLCLGMYITSIEIRPPNTNEMDITMGNYMEQENISNSTQNNSQQSSYWGFNSNSSLNSSKSDSSNSQSKSVWNNESKDINALNKVMKCSQLSIYCTREVCLGSVTDDELNLDFVRKYGYHRQQGLLLEPIDVNITFSSVYQKSNLLFGPINITVSIPALNCYINDEQLAFLTNFLVAFETHINRLQVSNRLSLCHSEPIDVSRRARMR